MESIKTEFKGAIYNIIEDIWYRIELDYNRGVIPSERHMQSLIYHYLTLHPAFRPQWGIRIEPTIWCPPDALHKEKMTAVLGMIPDMLIVDEKEKVVLAHLELKYNPMGYIQYEKDLEFFESMFNNENEIKIPLDTDPLTGNWKMYPDSSEYIFYSLSENLLPIYLVVCKYDSNLFGEDAQSWISDHLGINKLLLLSGRINYKSTCWNCSI